MNSEVYPNLDKVDKQDRELMKSMLKKSGELGLMGISIPEEYNGFGQSFVTQMLAAETIGAGYSFSVAFMAHCGIGTLPIMYYGNEEQRQKYVTKLATGELIGRILPHRTRCRKRCQCRQNQCPTFGRW